eukprot:1160142-Pelagomonas_calceolata.AAC.5
MLLSFPGKTCEHIHTFEEASVNSSCQDQAQEEVHGALALGTLINHHNTSHALAFPTNLRPVACMQEYSNLRGFAYNSFTFEPFQEPLFCLVLRVHGASALAVDNPFLLRTAYDSFSNIRHIPHAGSHLNPIQKVLYIGKTSKQHPTSCPSNFSDLSKL